MQAFDVKCLKEKTFSVNKLYQKLFIGQSFMNVIWYIRPFCSVFSHYRILNFKRFLWRVACYHNVKTYRIRSRKFPYMVSVLPYMEVKSHYTDIYGIRFGRFSRFVTTRGDNNNKPYKYLYL